MMIKSSVQKEDVVFVKFYTPNLGASKYIKQVLIDLNSNTIILEDYNIPFTSMARSFTQKISVTSALNDMLEQIYTEHSIQKQQNMPSF